MQDLYMQYKGLMFKLAYQLTGSVADAEDAVQDVFIKAYNVPPEQLTEPKAYLCKMVTNRCKDLLKSARKKREQYFGEWLPEPYLASNDNSMESVVRDDLLSYGMLVMLEKLSPSERAVFVLREALGFEYSEISELIEKSEVSCRKFFSRARAKMGLQFEYPVHPQAESQQWIHEFLGALKQGNMNQLLSLLDKDVILVSDGGGKVLAAVEPIKTREHVARFLLGPVRNLATIGEEIAIELVQFNGQPAIVIRSQEGVIHTVGLFHIQGDLIHNVYFVRNPDKLNHVG
ncbi:RNA polymerase sigma factor SigJ [Paenibacillus lautus]